jgi:DNA-binding transcriptional MerR regulator
MTLDDESPVPDTHGSEEPPTGRKRKRKKKDRGDHHLRMKDLCAATGLERQAIHFYIQQGLLPPGKKTGRNMAWYSDEHLQRLQLIKKLQHERFLPLKAIKAILDGREESFAPEQHQFLARVRDRLAPELGQSAPRNEFVDADEVCQRAGVERQDLEEAVEQGMLGAERTEGGGLRIAAEDVWMIETFGEMRRLGFSRELGFTVADVAFYEEAMSRLFREEMRLLSRRLSHLPPEEAAPMIERALPVIHTFLTRYHAQRVRDFFGSL